MQYLLILSVLVVALGGCATTPVPPEATTAENLERWQQRQQQLSAMHSWTIRGRVALFVNEDVYNLGLNWSLNETDSSLTLEASLGQGVIHLEKTGARVNLLTSEGESYSGSDAEQVLLESTGWSIPVDGLESWIKGINHKKSDYTPNLDSTGKATSLRQDDWRINFLEYAKTPLTEYNNPVLPRKIYMKRQNLALKIVIDQWKPQENAAASELFPTFPD